MTDALALQLVESGRYRVLDRTWLGVDSGTAQRTPLARLREIAKDAGVDYLVVGRVSKFSETRRYAPQAPMMVSPFSPAGYSPMRPGYAPTRPRTTTKRVDHLRLSIDLVDVMSGSVLTKASSTCDMPPKKRAGPHGATSAVPRLATRPGGRTGCAWAHGFVRPRSRPGKRNDHGRAGAHSLESTSFCQQVGRSA